MNRKLIIRVLGAILAIEGLAMIPSFLISLYYHDGDTAALGYITNITASIKNDIITCIAYEENTTMLLNIFNLSYIVALLSKYAPITYIESVNIFIVKYIDGDIIDIIF